MIVTVNNVYLADVYTFFSLYLLSSRVRLEREVCLELMEHQVVEVHLVRGSPGAGGEKGPPVSTISTHILILTHIPAHIHQANIWSCFPSEDLYTFQHYMSLIPRSFPK